MENKNMTAAEKLQQYFEHNRFHRSRHVIAMIGDELDADIITASMEFANRMGWDVGADGAELAEYQEFAEHVRGLQALVQPGAYENNPVRNYFYGE